MLRPPIRKSCSRASGCRSYPFRQALHPPCLHSLTLFYIHGFVLLTTLLLLGIATHPSTAYAGPERDWLTAHNMHRCMHGTSALQWSAKLSTLAMNTAKQCDCKHCNLQTANMVENIDCKTTAPANVVNTWYSEITNYTYDNPLYIAEGKGKDTGHFINVVAKGLHSVGCFCGFGECVCVYGGGFDNSPSGLKTVVPEPLRTSAQCHTTKMDYCWKCDGGTGKWEPQTTSCWRLEGYAPGTAGNIATECHVCWSFGWISACGPMPPPLPGVWKSVKGTVWASAGYPTGWTSKDAWRVVGGTTNMLRSTTPSNGPDLHGVKVGGLPACWVQLDASGAGVGKIACDY